MHGLLKLKLALGVHGSCLYLARNQNNAFIKKNRRIVRKNQLTFTANEAEPIQVYKRPEIEGDEMERMMKCVKIVYYYSIVS